MTDADMLAEIEALGIDREPLVAVPGREYQRLLLRALWRMLRALF